MTQASRILVVEDDADIARLVQINLVDAGYNVVHVADGAARSVDSRSDVAEAQRHGGLSSPAGG